MFAPLPITMVKLEAAIQLLDDQGIPPPPPDMLEIGERLRRVYASARDNQYKSLGRSELRKLPFAYWLQFEPDLSVVEPDLVRKYWVDNLPEALSLSPKRSKRWLTPLYFVYCEKFSSTDSEFKKYSSNFLEAVNKAQGLFAQKLLSLHESVRFFSPSEAPGRLAAYFFLDRSKSLDALLQGLELRPAFFGSSFGNAVLRSGLSLAVDSLREEQTIQRLLDWVKRGPSSVVKTDFRVPFANALLGCWAGRRPPDYLKNSLIEFFLAHYGDPRFQNHLHYQWDGVSAQAKGVILNWLTGDTLRGFMKLLRAADKMWLYRQKFWMAYYDQGHIEEAWIALGDDAWARLNTLKNEDKGLGCGRLEGGASSDQSILLLKIGDLVFSEWTHNGSLRAYKEGSKDAPRLYQRSYHGSELRDPVSLDFHNGMNMRPELTHAHSVNGSWQRKARDFIRRHTSVHLSDSEIL